MRLHLRDHLRLHEAGLENEGGCEVQNQGFGCAATDAFSGCVLEAHEGCGFDPDPAVLAASAVAVAPLVALARALVVVAAVVVSLSLWHPPKAGAVCASVWDVRRSGAR